MAVSRRPCMRYVHKELSKLGYKSWVMAPIKNEIVRSAVSKLTAVPSRLLLVGLLLALALALGGDAAMAGECDTTFTDCGAPDQTGGG